MISDQSLITGMVLQMVGGRGTSDVLPLQKGGMENVLAMLKKGHKTIWVVFTWLIEVLLMLKRGTKRFHLLKRRGGGCKRFYPVLRRGGGGGSQKVSDP